VGFGLGGDGGVAGVGAGGFRDERFAFSSTSRGMVGRRFVGSCGFTSAVRQGGDNPSQGVPRHRRTTSLGLEQRLVVTAQ